MKSAVIEDKNIIEKIKSEYRRKGWIRDLVLFVLSINTGAKLVSLLQLKVSDVKNKDFLKFKDTTNITRVFPLNKELKNLIYEFCKSRSSKEILFCSKKHPEKSITRIEVFRKFKNVCDSIGVYDNYSVASWRKTFGYHYYKQFGDILLLQWLFGQTSPQETLDYIDVKEDFNNRINREFSL